MDELQEIDEIRSEIIEDHSDADIKEIDKKVENLISIETSDSVVLFFTLAHEVLRGLSGDIIWQKVFDDDISKDNAREYARNIDSEDQENILYYMGIIDSGEKGEIANVRKTRNKLVHDMRSRQYLDGIGNIESRVRRAVKTVDKMHVEAHNLSLLD